MSGQQHTPGPWVFKRNRNRGGVVDGFGDRHRVATVHVGLKTNEGIEANGRLMAAAPDLLAVCRLVLEEDDAPEGRCLTDLTRDRLMDAIAKAEGQTEAADAR